MSARSGWKKLLRIARERTRFVCPLCDKLTASDGNYGRVKLRAVYCGHGTVLSGEVKHWLWTCEHCGATHHDQEEALIK